MSREIYVNLDNVYVEKLAHESITTKKHVLK